MTTRMDSADPTGVSADLERNARVQRNRKADAALQLRTAGASWSEIAMTLGFGSPRQAMLAVEKALVRQLNDEDDKSKMRAIAGARLDRLLRGLWAKAIDPNCPDQLAAVSRARELIADHTKLYGLAAPAEVVVSTPTQTELEEWVLRMTATMVPTTEEADIWDVDPEDDEPKAIGA